MPKIFIETRINTKREIVFDLARSIDLHKTSAKKTNEQAVAGITDGLIGIGESVTWRAKHFGVYQVLTSKITEFDYPNLFVDEMVKGAFKSFRHEHQFKEIEDFTIMADIFTYESPFGILGKFADFLFLKSYMKSFLRERNGVIKEYAESDKWKEILTT